MTCDICGSKTPRSTLCKSCARDERYDTRDTTQRDLDSSEYECTSCGALYVTDGSDPCPECGARRRRFAGEVVADGGRPLATCSCGALLNVNLSPEGTRYFCRECDDWIPSREVLA